MQPEQQHDGRRRDRENAHADHAPPRQSTPEPGNVPGGLSQGDGAPSEVDALRAERDRYLDMLRRTQADFENYQKRMHRYQESEGRYAILPLVRDLLPILDNLQRALQAARSAEEPAKVLEGVEIVARQLLDALARQGVTRIPAEGATFDPTVHEALMHQPDPDRPAGTVSREVEPGYQLYERVVRPSRVVVSSGPPEQ